MRSATGDRTSREIRESLRALTLVLALAASPLLLSCEAVVSGDSPSADAAIDWRGAAGDPLPFGTVDDLLGFLREAEVVEVREMPTGVTEAEILTLALDGAVARAAFHDHHLVRERQRLDDGTTVNHFRDTYLSQVAAWEVAHMLGVSNTPPTVVREIDGSTGSLQLWVEGAMTELERRDGGLVFPDRTAAYRQVYDMDILDALINNRDRSQGNFLWDGDWRLWLIDHTRAFGREEEVPSQRSIRRCSYPLWEALRALDSAEVATRLAPYMGPEESAAVMARRDEILRLLEARIVEDGREAVLFRYDDPT